MSTERRLTCDGCQRDITGEDSCAVLVRPMPRKSGKYEAWEDYDLCTDCRHRLARALRALQGPAA